MVQINDPRHELARRIYQSYIDRREDWRRPHLGASIIGRECLRQLWYIFRWFNDPGFDGRMLRLFERGQREEPWIVEDMRAAGLTVHDRDPETGEQIRVSWVGGHFGGSCDGVVLGVPEAPEKWHIWECKTSNTKGFRELERKGVEVAKPEHYAQMQVYMLGLGLDRALYTVVAKETDHIYTERVRLKRREAEGLIAKAAGIVFSGDPPVRISEDPSWYKCKMCHLREVCHGGEVETVEKNCRTCTHSSPTKDGMWMCGKFTATITPDAQRAGCEEWVGREA